MLPKANCFRHFVFGYFTDMDSLWLPIMACQMMHGPLLMQAETFSTIALACMCVCARCSTRAPSAAPSWCRRQNFIPEAIPLIYGMWGHWDPQGFYLSINCGRSCIDGCFALSLHAYRRSLSYYPQYGPTCLVEHYSIIYLKHTSKLHQRLLGP